MVKKCINAHFYDGDKFPVCPHCGAPDENAAAVSAPQPHQGTQNVPFYHQPPQPPTAADDEDATIPLAFYQRNGRSSVPAAAAASAPLENSAEQSDQTELTPPAASTEIPVVAQSPVIAAPAPSQRMYNPLLPPLQREAPEAPQATPAPWQAPQTETTQPTPAPWQAPQAEVTQPTPAPWQAPQAETTQPTPAPWQAPQAEVTQPTPAPWQAPQTETTQPTPAPWQSPQTETTQPTPAPWQAPQAEAPQATPAPWQAPQTETTQPTPAPQPTPQTEAPQPDTSFAKPETTPAVPSEQTEADADKETTDLIVETSEDEQTEEVYAGKTTGWLVALSGAHYGESFELKSGSNTLGAVNAAITLNGDDSISGIHAEVSFDSKKNAFFAKPCEGSLFINDQPVDESVCLKAYDQLTLGQTKLLFFPLCGEDFSWKDTV